jgi:hypothetical protein
LRYQEAGSEPKTACWYRADHALDAAAYYDQAEWLSEMIGISIERLAVPVDPQVLAAYAGRYQVSNGIVVTIRVDGARIFGQVPKQPEYELYARSESQFSPFPFEAEITFYKNNSGEVDRLVIVQDGVTTEAKKVP